MEVQGALSGFITGESAWAMGEWGWNGWTNSIESIPLHSKYLRLEMEKQAHFLGMLGLFLPCSALKTRILLWTSQYEKNQDREFV